jgi:hypothetical protein
MPERPWVFQFPEQDGVSITRLASVITDTLLIASCPRLAEAVSRCVAIDLASIRRAYVVCRIFLPSLVGFAPFAGMLETRLMQLLGVRAAYSVQILPSLIDENNDTRQD